MINIHESSIIDILPDNIKKDNNVKALSYAISNQVKKIVEHSEGTGIFAKIDTLPDKILDLLAIEFRTQYYKQTLPIDLKKLLIKNTLSWYARAGTPAAVEELISAVFGYGKEVDWYEYSGKPGYFKIETTNQEITNEAQVEFLRLLDSIKRKSAWLEGIEIVLESQENINIFICNYETDFEFSKPISI